MMKTILFLSLLSTLFEFSKASLVCQDDPLFRYNNGDHLDCDWILSAGGCDWSTDTGFHVGQWFCPVSCGQCEFRVPDDYIKTDKLCYNSVEEPIEVIFENRDPDRGDWMGIYPAKDLNSTDLGNPIDWQYLCATHHHRCKIKYGSHHFMMLEPGEYKAVLTREAEEPYSSYAESLTFEVAGPDNSCSGRRRDLHQEVSTSSSSSHYDTDCTTEVQVNKTSFNVGEEIGVSLKQCLGSYTARDFVAIYDADMSLEDINGDNNYRLWLWPCGSQLCHHHDEEFLELYKQKHSDMLFGAKGNRNTWPLPPGSYQVHLVHHQVGDNVFSSFAASSVFEVKEEPTSTQKYVECQDQILSETRCYEEGQVVAVDIKNDCGLILNPGEWIGFYPDQPNKAANDLYFGEPLFWTDACKENADDEDCQSNRFEFMFHIHHKDNKDTTPLLEAGTYRVVLIGSAYRKGGPYKARLVSNSFEVHAVGEPCIPSTPEDTDS